MFGLAWKAESNEYYDDDMVKANVAGDDAGEAWRMISYVVIAITTAMINLGWL